VKLNQRANLLCDQMLRDAETLRVRLADRAAASDGDAAGLARLIDCGIDAAGGLEAGRRMAEICLASLAQVDFVPGDAEIWPDTAVQVRTDHPVAACMASQYAGWEVKGDGFFAMGSGPMRAAAGREELFETIGHLEQPHTAVGVLECAKLPTEEVCRDLAEKCGVAPDQLTLLLAPTSSQAGTVQVVARSVETSLHKLFELGFDLSRVESGVGTAPLPPVAGDDLTGIGRTNDALLYGGQVTLYVRGDDESLEAIGPKVPSSASADHGQPFAQLFERYDHDFYKIDPMLFSPAIVRFVNLDSGRLHHFGHTLPRVIHESFGGV
jgi:methenyltetrahydromethanopterin cyclohydrolase